MAFGPWSKPQVHILLIGEAPGVVEDTNGLPFTGPAGQLLREAIKLAKPYCRRCYGGTYDGTLNKACDVCMGHGELVIGLTNLICCRPYDSPTNPRTPKNREPSHKETMNCQPRLIDTIIAVNPMVIVFLGRVPQSYRYDIKQELENLGMEIRYENIPHPSYILRKGGLEYNKSYVENFSNLFEHFYDCYYTTYDKPSIFDYSPRIEDNRRYKDGFKGMFDLMAEQALHYDDPFEEE